MIHFKSKGVFPWNINRRDKAWWFMIGPSHGIHQSSWLKLHWVVYSSVSLISFLSEPALCVTKCNWNSCKGEFFFHFGSISHNTKWCDLFFEILINWSILYFWSKFHWVPSENYRWRNWLKKKNKYIYIYIYVFLRICSSTDRYQIWTFWSILPGDVFGRQCFFNGEKSAWDARKFT